MGTGDERSSDIILQVVPTFHLVFPIPDPDHVTRDDDSGKNESRTDRRCAAPNCSEERQITLYDSGIGARLRDLLLGIKKLSVET